jgi:hypothetical protein
MTERAALSHELDEAVTTRFSKNYDDTAPGGRLHRLVVLAHPLPQRPATQEQS